METQKVDTTPIRLERRTPVGVFHEGYADTLFAAKFMAKYKTREKHGIVYLIQGEVELRPRYAEGRRIDDYRGERTAPPRFRPDPLPPKEPGEVRRAWLPPPARVLRTVEIEGQAFDVVFDGTAGEPSEATL